MALPGELEFYAAGSGLPADATLNEHKAGYFRAQLAGEPATHALHELEYDFYLNRTGLTRSFATFTDARYAYFKGQLGTGYDIDSMLRDFFAAPPTINLAIYPVSTTTNTWSVSGFGTGGVGTHDVETGTGPGGRNVHKTTWTTAASSGGSTTLASDAANSETAVVTAGKTYTLLIWGQASATAASAGIEVIWTDSAGNSVAPATRPAAGATAGQWKLYSVTEAAPPGATRVRSGFRINDLTGTTNGFYTRATMAMVVEGAYTGVFSDGNTPGWAWDGTPGASTSRGPNYTLLRVAGANPAVSAVGTLNSTAVPDGALTVYSVGRHPDSTLAPGYWDLFKSPAGSWSAAVGLRRLIAATGNIIRHDVVRTDDVLVATSASASGSDTLSALASTLTDAGMTTQRDYLADAVVPAQTPVVKPLGTGNLVRFGYRDSAIQGAPDLRFSAVFAGEHSRATREAVVTWLANAYGIPITAPVPDVTAPNPGTIAGSAITSTGFTLTISGASDAGGLHATPYAFSTDNGASWSLFQASNVFVASGLSASTGYTVKGRVRDAALNQADTAGVLVTTSSGAFVPTDIAGLTGWWDASDASTFTFGTGSAVAQWRDKSGMARHVSQATAAKQPTRDQTVNGLSAVKFNAAAAQILRDTHAASPRPRTAWAIVRPDTASANTEVFIGHSNMSLRSGTNYGMDATASLYSSQPDTNGVVAFVAGVFRDDTTSTIHVNGTTATGNAGTIGSGTMAFSLGGNNSDAEHASYTICETGVYDGPLTAPQIAQLYAYAQSKWGTP